LPCPGSPGSPSHGMKITAEHGQRKLADRNGNEHCKDQEISCRYFRVLVGLGLSENGVPHIFIFTDKNLYIPIHIALSETRVPYNSMVSHHLFRLNPLFSIIENLKYPN
jgi:hypothetical protein